MTDRDPSRGGRLERPCGPSLDHPGKGPRGPDDPSDCRGQVLVLFVLSLVVILGFGSLVIDAGRFYSERRFLQNAADAGALAAAGALIRGATQDDAASEARAIITRNVLHSPTGSGAAAPPTTPEYEPGHAGDPLYLTNGILVSGTDIRVAVRGDTAWTLGGALGLGPVPIITQARARTTGDLLPAVVRQFINAPGPTVGASAPCAGDVHDFGAFVATADTACLGTETNASLRIAPSPGMAYDAVNPNNDPAHHGPIFTLVGIGAKPSNNADFRGFAALDIRNFSSAGSNVFYNGVTAGTTANTLKNLEAGWARNGYPGPGFPPVVAPPDPNDQVGLLDGNSSGIVLDAIAHRYRPGDEIMAAVYSGTVMAIPDFTLTAASTIPIGTTENRDGAVTMTASKNKAFAGTVTTAAFKDWGDPANPYGGALSALTFSPNPATPDTPIPWTTFSTTAAPVGIYTIWIQGHASSPYLTDHYYPVAINIGGVQRDFTSDAGGATFLTPTTGGTATGTITVSTANSNSTAFEGTVALAIEGGAASNGVLPAGIGTTSLSSSSVVLNKGDSQTITVSLNAGSLGPGEYSLTLAASGTNSAGQKVTRLFPISLAVATAGTQNVYVDITGFAVFRITRTSSNELEGYAISDAYADMNDPRLRRGQTARLVPWTD